MSTLVFVTNFTIYVLWSERGYIGNTLPLLPLVSSHANPTTWYQSLGFDYFPQPLTISAPLRFFFSSY
jgi:hypothetical protein